MDGMGPLERSSMSYGTSFKFIWSCVENKKLNGPILTINFQFLFLLHSILLFDSISLYHILSFKFWESPSLQPKEKVGMRSNQIFQFSVERKFGQRVVGSCDPIGLPMGLSPTLGFLHFNLFHWARQSCSTLCNGDL